MSSKKLVVVIGVTGNQGGSVANAFLEDPQWAVKGISRNVESQASQSLTQRGVQMVQADLDDPHSLIEAFRGANLIFSVTDFWQFFFNPASYAIATERGIELGRYAYEREVQHGKNIVDAAASADVLSGLDDQVGFIASTLSSAKTCSDGQFQELWHFDAKADVFPAYVQDKYPDLAKRMSFVQTGVFMSSWRYSPEMFMGWNTKIQKHEMKFSAPPDAVLPHLDVRSDVGLFVKALLMLPPGSVVMAAGIWCSWSEYMKTWESVTGRKAVYKQVTTSEMDKMIPGGFGKEVGEMWEYSANPGYDGGDRSVLRLDDLQKMGISIPVTSLQDYMNKEDYTVVYEAVKNQ